MKPLKLIFSIGAFLLFLNVNDVYGQCNDHILVSSTNICQGQSLTFTLDNQSFGSYSYTWYVDDVSQNTTGNSFLYQFNSAGIIEIKYEVNNSCKDSVQITVNSLPTANFTFNNNNQCAPVLVNFTNTTNGGTAPYTHTWFDNGTTFSALQNPNRSFDEIASGNVIHNIQLTVQDANGCTDQISQSVTVKGRPDARIGDATIDEVDFIRCSGSSNISILVVDSSTTTNSNYHIDWGDGSAVYNSPTLPNSPNSLQHIYTNLVGYDTLTLTVTGNNGCTSIRKYELFNGIQPAASLGIPILPSIVCADYSVDFPITLSDISQNTNGTIYIIYFDDGTPNDTLYHPLTDSLYNHNFTKTSCGNTAVFGGQSNAFSLRMKAYNACSDATNDVAPIRLGHPPIPEFTYQSQVCVNTNTLFVNTSDSAFYNNNGNCFTSMKQKWIITPLAGIVFNSADSLSTLDVQFTQAGTYNVEMRVWNKCMSGLSEAESINHQICVLQEPQSAFNIGTNQQSDTTGCVPFTINNITNTSNTVTGSCFESYQWNVATISSNCAAPNATKWEFIGGTSDTSKVPQIRFLESGEYTLQLFISNVCGTSSFTRTITVQDKPNIALGTIPSVCQQEEFSPTLQTFNNCYVPTTAFSWTATGGTIEFPNQQTPGTVSFNSSGTKTIQVTATNVCGSNTANTAITVKSLPIPPTLTGNTPCVNDTIIITTDATNATPNITYGWDYPDNNLTYSIANVTRIGATTNMQGTYLLTVTDQQNCSDTVSVFVPVYPLPTIQITASDQTPCVFSPITLTASGATNYTWQLQNGNSTTNPLSLNPTQDSTYQVIGTDGNGCKNTANIFIDTKPLPTVNAGVDTVACFQNPPIPIQLVGTQNTGNSNAGTWSAVGNIAPNTISSSGLFTPNAVANNIELTYTYTDPNTGCSNSDVMEVDVINAQIANAGSDITVCENDAIIDLTIIGNSANGIWRNASNNIITQFNPNTPGTFQLTYTIGVGSCLSQDVLSIIVNPLPTITITASDPTPCVLENIILTASGATNYTWQLQNGNSTTNPLSLNPTADSTYQVIGVDNNGCENTANIFIDTKPLPIVNAGMDTVACFQNPPIPIQLTGTQNTGNSNTGTWSAVGNIAPNTISPNGIFTPNQVTSNIQLVYTYTNPSTGCQNSDMIEVDVITPQVANAGSDITVCQNAAVIDLITIGNSTNGIWRDASNNIITQFNPNTPGTFQLTYTIGAGSCISQDMMTITVNPLPTVSVQNDFTICRYDTTISLTANISGGTWSGTGIESGTANFNPINVSNNSTTLNYTFTDGNSCTNDDDLIVTINDVTTANAGNDISFCNITTDIQLTGFSPTTNGTGTWSGNGIQNNNQGIFNSNGVSGTYEVYYTFENNNGCFDTDTLEITVNNLIKPKLQNDTAICINTPNLTLTASEPNGIWTINGNSFSNPFTTNQSGIFEIIYEIESGTTCENSDTLEIRVENLPQITVTQDTSVCADSAPIDLFESPFGGTWSGTGITNVANGTFDVSNGSQTVTYTYTEIQIFYDDTLRCTDNNSVNIIVNSLPNINVPNTAVYCLISDDITLPNGLPTGGNWSGLGITPPNLFNPTIAGGIGNYTVTYSYTDANGCENSDTMNITVEAADSVSAGFNDTVCITEPAALLTDFYPTSGGIWSGNVAVTSNGLFNPVQAGAGLKTLTFTYGNGSCQVIKSKTILVVDTTVINAGIDQTACFNEPAFQLTGFSPTGGFWTGTDIDSNGIFTPTSEGSFLLKYTFVEPVNSCISEDYLTITINPLPIPEAGLDTILCSVNDTISLPNGTANVTGNGVWTGSNGIIDNTNLAFSVNPSIIGVSTIPLYFTFTDNYNCSVTDFIELEIISPVAIDAGLADSVCFNTGLDTLVGYPTGGIWSSVGNVITNAGSFDSNINPNIYTLTYTYNDGNGGCEVSDTRQRTVRGLPVINAGQDETRCLNEPPFQLQNYSPQGGIWTGTNVNSSGLFTPVDTGTFQLTYTYVDFFGCENFDTKTIIIHALPIPNAQDETTLCAVNTIIALPSGTANVGGSGVWTGSNAIIPNTNLSVNPSIIGANDSSFLYFTFTDNYNCSVTDTMKLVVIASDSINAGLPDTVCINVGLDTLIGYPAGGVWSGTGIIQDSIFNNINNNTPAGVYTLTYTFDNGNGGCEVTDIRERTVRALPVVDGGLDTLVCIETPAFTMFGFSPITDLLGIGVWTGNGITNQSLGIFESDTAGVSTHTLTYTFTDFVGCVNSDTRIIDVVDLPIIDSLKGLDTLCNQPFPVQYVGYQNSGNPNAGVWSGQNMASDGTFTPNGVGDFTVYYCYTDNNTCERCDSMMITVISPEPIEAGVGDTICIDEGIHLLTAEFPNGGFWSGSSAILDVDLGTFDPLIAGSGWHTVTYIFGTGTCLVSDTTGVYVRDLAFVDAGADENACDTDADFAISGFSPTGGVWSGSGVVNNLGIFSPNSVASGTYPITYFYTDSTTGCDTSRIKNVFIHPLAAPDFTLDTILCINVPYTISDLSTNTTQWHWDFGDGTTYATQNPTHTYTTTGNYTIKLIATSQHGCKDSTFLNVFVTEIPTASFIKDTANGCTPLPVTFTNTSTGDLMSYSWNLGNSSPLITSLNPPTTIYTDGTQDTTYYITLTTANLCGSMDFTDSILVYPKPQIFFTPDVNSGCTPLTVDFYNNTLGNPDVFYWNYGNGNLDTLTNSNTHSHIFYTDTTPTIYNIVLIAANECGLDTADVNITVNPVTVESFFNASTTSGCQPLTVNFANYSTPGTTVIWNFGDGSSSDTISSTSHTFQQAGTFKTIQYVTNGCGYDSTFVWVNVLPAPTASFISQNNICEDLPLTFTNTSINTIGQTWDFGDGTTSTDSIATHTYTSAGTYQVTLTAFNNTSQCSGFTTQTITILPKPIAIFAASDTTGCEDLTVQFTDNSIGNITGHNYNFGDSNGSASPSPTHTYLDSGVYTVQYFVVDANTCVSDVVTNDIVVYPIPTSNFAFAILDSCAIPAQVAFTNLSQGAVGYEWTVNNSGNILTTTNPLVTYTNGGIYNINLTAINTFGCQDSSQQSFELFAPPVAAWTVDQPNSCLPSEVFYTNSSTGTGLIHRYNFGDNNTTTVASPTHIFNNVGTYNSTYFVTDMNGCSSDTLSEIIEVFPVPTSDFSFEILDSCTIPTLVAFTNLSQGATSYEWRLDNGQILGNINPTTYYNQAGIYTIELVAENSFSCRDSSQQTFEIYAPPTGFVTYEQLDTCEPSLVQFYSNATNTTDYFWNFGNGQTSTAFEPIATYQNAGIYNISLIIGTDNICFDTLNYSNFVQVYPRPFANFEYLDTMVDGRFKGIVKFYNTSIGANQYSWDFGDNTTSNLENPLHAFLSNGLFDVELIATNSYNCADDTIISVRPDFFGTLEVPNIMAPNFGTGEDRFFIPKGIGLETYLVEVFDKQGTRIWFSDEIDADGRPTGKWDGTYQHKDLPQGAYVWKVKAQFINGTTVHRTGTVTIVR